MKTPQFDGRERIPPQPLLLLAARHRFTREDQHLRIFLQHRLHTEFWIGHAGLCRNIDTAR